MNSVEIGGEDKEEDWLLNSKKKGMAANFEPSALQTLLFWSRRARMLMQGLTEEVERD